MATLPKLSVSANRRYLVTENGDPFFWLGDTAWELVHRLKRDEVERYMETRSTQGFNVVQTVALAELDGLLTPNAYGHLPFHDLEPSKPDEGYFQDLDFVISAAARQGIYVALLPTWADKVTLAWGAGPVVFNKENARSYGRFLGSRYRTAANLVWVLGGDRPMHRADHDWSPIWQAMATGIREVLGDEALLTYHPDGGSETPKTVHRASWSDFVMIQSGHWAAENPTWQWIEELYRLEPPKPVLDGEPNYEDHPVAPWPKWDPKSGYFRDYEVRKQTYRSVFAGGFGVTYGHHFVWQMWDEGREPVNNGAERMPWQEAILRPGAKQMSHLKQLMLSRPFLDRIPDQSLIASTQGEGGNHIRATRDREGSYAMVYFPNPALKCRLNLSQLAKNLKGWWFNPRNGMAEPISREIQGPMAEVESPSPGPDSVLVLDDASRGYLAPGTTSGAH